MEKVAATLGHGSSYDNQIPSLPRRHGDRVAECPGHIRDLPAVRRIPRPSAPMKWRCRRSTSCRTAMLCSCSTSTPLFSAWVRDDDRLSLTQPVLELRTVQVVHQTSTS